MRWKTALSRRLNPLFLLMLSCVMIVPATMRAQVIPPPMNTVNPAEEAPLSPLPDQRYKADILVIVAHPDDETAISGYLVEAISEGHKRVAVIFGTPGNSGGNEVGYEQATSLGVVRELEARKALASIGVSNVFFLRGTDTPGGIVLRSLETWGHGTALEQTVRLIRLTRPEVILTWLPHSVVGENHGDHQASAVIATEAFDLAGDPTAYPEQVTFPRNRTQYSNLTEGLRPWQPQKLYFFSDASQMSFMQNQGPTYPVTRVSPTFHLPYDQVIAKEEAYHLTQGDTGQAAKQALETGNFKDFQAPIRFIFGKSLVGGAVTGDIFEGVVPGPIPFVPAPGYKPQKRAGLSIELGGAWAYYRKFWAAHAIGHLANLMDEPEVGVEPGGLVEIPLLLRNDTAEAQKIRLEVQLPAGWTQQPVPSLYPVRAHDVYPVNVTLTPPATRKQGWQSIVWRAESKGKAIGAVTIKAMQTTPTTEQIH